MTEETKNKIEALIGREFNYQGKNIVIARYKEVSGTNVVFFDNKNRLIVNLFINELDEFINNLFSPLEKDLGPMQVAIPQNKLVIFEPVKENASIKQTLLDTLQKVKTDKEYIPQAKAVCEIVGEMVKLQKAELDILKFASNRK